MNPLEKAMIAWSMNIDIDPQKVDQLDTFKFKIALKLSGINFNQQKLLSFKIFKYILGIKIEFLREKVDSYVEIHPDQQKEVDATFSTFSKLYWKKDEITETDNKANKLFQENFNLNPKKNHEIPDFAQLLHPYLNNANPLVKSTPLEERKDLEGAGTRTKKAFVFLEKLQDFKEGHIIFDGIKYTPITSHQFGLSTGQFVSSGSFSSRELVLVDFEQSPHLQEHYNELVSLLESAKKNGTLNPSTEVSTLLQIIKTYVRTEIFPTCNNPSLENETEQAIEEYRTNHPDSRLMLKDEKDSVSVVPIDYFVEKKLGVCRHHALVTALLIDRLISEHGDSLIPNGVVQHVRDIIKTDNEAFAHVWLTLVESNGTKWHIDTLWDMVEDLSDSTGVDNLKKIYGPTAIDNQLAKANIALEKAQKTL